MKKAALALFIKYPEPGKVKTRLARELGENNAAKLYRRFISDISDMLRKIDGDVYLFFTPAEKEEKLTRLLKVDFPLVPQIGKNLGEKMFNAFRYLFMKGYAHGFLLGSDVPHISQQTVKEALKALKSFQAVLGPASDGGYYAIGFTEDSLQKSFFEDIQWGTDSVFSSTMKKLNRFNLKIHLLKKMTDVDTMNDLLHLYRNRHECFPATSMTFKYLEEKKIFSENSDG